MEGTAIVAFRAGGVGHLGVAFYNSYTGKWIAGAIEGSPEREISNLLGAWVQTNEENGGWYKEFDTKEDVLNEFFSNTEPDASSGYPGHDAYDNVNIISVEKSYPVSASKIFPEVEDSGYLLMYHDCISLTNSVLSAYGVEDRPGGYNPLETPSYNPNVLDLQETLVPNVYFYGLPGTKISKESWDTSVESSFGVNSDLGGINFTSIKLNSIAISTDQDGGVNFNLTLKAQKANGTNPIINPINATRLGAIAFMTGLAVPNDKFWVNLNPSEADRIIDEELAHSDVGRIMLEADFQMKKDSGNYENPCSNETGKALSKLLGEKHDALVQQCMNKFPGEIKDTSSVSFTAVTRYWIVPDKVYAYSNETQIYIINSTLNISSEPLADESTFELRDQDIETLSKDCYEELNRSAKDYAEFYENLSDRMTLPYIIADVNYGGKYEDLRVVYVALALAQWYKSKMTPHTDIFREGLDSSSSAVLTSQNGRSPKEIWDKYVYSYKSSEYKCWENTTTKNAGWTNTSQHLHKMGGVEFENIGDHLIMIDYVPKEVKDQNDRAVSKGFVDQNGDVLFGYRLHVDQKEATPVMVSSSESSSDTLSSKYVEKNPPSNNKIDNTSNLTNEAESTKNKETPFITKVADNASLITCPGGWMGPDEKGECWQMQIIS
ncbi:MAG TPA: hypothetical protein HA232_02985 [Methanocellales archaeon]|nr:hypothetical protein [Methanocellales archaeon]